MDQIDIPKKVMASLDTKELTAGIIASGVNMEHPSGIAMKAIGGLTLLLWG